MLAEQPFDDINGSVGIAEKRFSINFSKAKTKFCLTLHYNGDDSYLFVNRKKIYKFKADNKHFNFPVQFCLGSISEKLDAVEQVLCRLKSCSLRVGDS